MSRGSVERNSYSLKEKPAQYAMRSLAALLLKCNRPAAGWQISGQCQRPCCHHGGLRVAHLGRCSSAFVADLHSRRKSFGHSPVAMQVDDAFDDLPSDSSADEDDVFDLPSDASIDELEDSQDGSIEAGDAWPYVPVEALLRLSAATDRGQRASEADRERLAELVRQCESAAPAADALDLNGEWRLVCALGEAAYRSSPFFWAFRQATDGLTTPVGIPGSDVQAGGSWSSAVYGFTDLIPFYDIGSATQRFVGVSSDQNAVTGSATGNLESQVKLEIGRLFGLPSMSSLMTTTAAVQTMPRSDRSVEVELQIQRTAAKQSTIASLLPVVDQFLDFPSGDALELLREGSSYVRLRSTFPTRDLRISRPVLVNAPAAEVGGVFVYVREPIQ